MAKTGIRFQPTALVRRTEVITMVCGEGMLQRLEAAGWLTPRVRARRYVVYRRMDVEAVVVRLDAGEIPPQIPKKKK